MCITFRHEAILHESVTKEPFETEAPLYFYLPFVNRIEISISFKVQQFLHKLKLRENAICNVTLTDGRWQGDTTSAPNIRCYSRSSNTSFNSQNSTNRCICPCISRTSKVKILSMVQVSSTAKVEVLVGVPHLEQLLQFQQLGIEMHSYSIRYSLFITIVALFYFQALFGI